MKTHLFYQLLAVVCLASINSVYAQNDLMNFYNKYRQKFLADLPLQIANFDKANGYLSCCVLKNGNCIGASERYDIAMWVSNTGKKIFGVCGYGCSTGGCWCISLNNLTFYDANLNEVTDEVADMFGLELLATNTEVRGYDGKPMELERSEYAYRIEIPRIGTTIKIVKGVPLFGEKHFANLVYNLNTGKFTIVPIR